MENNYTLSHHLVPINEPTILSEIVNDFDLEWYYGDFQSQLIGVQLLELDKIQMNIELQQSIPNLDEIIMQKRIELIFNN